MSGGVNWLQDVQTRRVVTPTAAVAFSSLGRKKIPIHIVDRNRPGYKSPYT